jgi:hypothetical protein
MLALSLGRSTAHADVVFELIPSVSVGVTDNALLTVTPVRDEFGVLGVNAHLRSEGARSIFTLGYRLGVTRYFERHGIDTVTNAVLGQSLFRPTAKLELLLTAGGTLSRSSGIDAGDVSAVIPAGTAGGTTAYFNTTAGEELTYRPRAQYLLGQSLTFGRLDYFGAAAPGLPSGSTTLTGAVHGDLIRARDIFSLGASLTDFFASAVPGTTGESQTWLVDVRGRWHRSISVALATDLEVGVAAAYRSGIAAQYGPTFLAGVGYHRELWFATLVVSQSQVANPFLAQVTTNDQALARLAVPLNRQELVTLGGFASYLRANQGTGYTRLYDQRAAGAVLSAHLARRPFWGAIEYTYLNQQGNPAVNSGIVPTGELHRQLLILSLGGSFAWGPGTPPLFHSGI